MELANVLRGELHDADKLRVDGGIGRVQLCGRDLERDALGAVEPRVILHKRGVAVLADVGDDFCDRAGHVAGVGLAADELGVGRFAPDIYLQHGFSS